MQTAVILKDSQYVCTSTNADMKEYFPVNRTGAIALKWEMRVYLQKE